MEMQMPSGALYGPREFALIEMMLDSGSISRRDTPVTFRCGLMSNYYVELRNDFTENPKMQLAFGQYLLDLVTKLSEPRSYRTTPCLIGVATAGTPFASAVSVVSAIGERRPVHWRQMRQVKKVDHGKSFGWTDSAPLPTHWYLPIEQLTSEGKSLLDAINRLKEDGYPVHDMHPIMVIDWELGAPELLTEHGFHQFTTLFKMRDVAFAARMLNKWSVQMLEEVHDMVGKYRRSKGLL